MKIDEATFLVIDTETTGLDPAEDEILEIAVVATSLERASLGMWATFVCPTKTIAPEVSAVHGITESDVFLAPVLDTALRDLAAFSTRFIPFTPTAHNLDFDMGFLEAGNNLRVFGDHGLCTKRLAMKLWPKYPAHKNMTLRYRRNLHVEDFGIAPHRALGDALVTAALLLNELSSLEFRALEIETVEALIEWNNRPIRIELMPFGKHKGEAMETLPRSYVDWLIGNIPDLSTDMRYTLGLHFGVPI